MDAAISHEAMGCPATAQAIVFGRNWTPGVERRQLSEIRFRKGAYGSRCRRALAPSKGGGDLSEDCLDDMGVVVDPQLVGYGQEQRVGFGNGLVLR
jgi:hypothetical protein